jgi:hypothetical protein
MGRPRSIDIHLPQSIVEKLFQGSRLSIRADALVRDISRETVRHLRYKMCDHFYDSVPVPPLGADARQQRVQFCQKQLVRDDFDLKSIIFTDESTVHQDLNLGGIWRKGGEQCNDAIYVKVAHKISAMIWGAIAKGFRTRLLRRPRRVNTFSYMQMLADGAIFRWCREKLGPKGFYWQQNNAPAHGPGGEVIAKQFCMLDWPPHSPDLSTIEMLWSVIKRKLKCRTFQNDDELFSAIEIVWNEIPEAEIDKLVGSFRARCQVCVEIEGECVNGHWWRVHQIHHNNDPANVLQDLIFVEE